jgi:glycopeptide antibiotics resistance protein
MAAVAEITAEIPYLVPGSLVALALSIAASGIVGRWLGVNRSVAWVGLFSLGVILSITLSPLDQGIVQPPRDVRACEFTRTSLASLVEVTTSADVAFNIFMFVPFGWAIGLAPWSMRKLVVLLAATALPLTIEAAQLLVIQLGRGCEGADIVDNLTGLAIGFALGTVLALLTQVFRRLFRPPVTPGG